MLPSVLRASGLRQGVGELMPGSTPANRITSRMQQPVVASTHRHVTSININVESSFSSQSFNLYPASQHFQQCRPLPNLPLDGAPPRPPPMDHPGWGVQSRSCLTPAVPVYSRLSITRPAKYLPRYQTLPDNSVKPVPRDSSSTVVWEQIWMQGREQTQRRRDRSDCCVNKATVEGQVERVACLSCLTMAVFLPQPPSGAAFGRALVPRSESAKDSPISRSFPLCCA